MHADGHLPFELGYKLALACKDDVSDSPGFESCRLILYIDKCNASQFKHQKRCKGFAAPRRNYVFPKPAEVMVRVHSDYLLKA